MDEAKRYYQTACQMDPGNAEYRQALEFMENGTQQAYHPRRRAPSEQICAAAISVCRCAVLYSLCSGGGYYF